MQKKMKKAMMILLMTVLLVSLGMTGYSRYQAYLSEKAYREAQELAEQNAQRQPTPVEKEEEKPPEPEEPIRDPVEEPQPPQPEEPEVWREAPVTDDPYMDQLKSVDLAALREVNPDVVGWIVIPGTKVEYPLMQGEDNDYYLKHTWKKKASSAGSIFLEKTISPDLSDFNTIVYGHRMINNSMFGSLKYYKKQTYWAEHPYVYIVDDAGVHRYEIFSAYEASVKGYTYQISFADETGKETFLDKCMGWSVIETGVTPTIRDRILTLSTCTGTGYETRWVVQARLAAAE